MQQLFTFPTEELKQENTIYVSITMELHALSLTDDKDRIQFENLLDEAKKKLADSTLDEKDKLLKQLDKVRVNQAELLNHKGGLAMYITTDDIYYYVLAVPVEKSVSIGKLPYTLPLVENFQYEQDYHLLLLNRDNVKIYEGHGPNISQLDMTEIDEEAPIDLETAIGTERSGGQLNFGTFKSTTGGGGSSQFFHGHNETSQEKDIDRENYFRIVDRFIYDNYSKKTEWPLIVFSVEDNQSVFHRISGNQYLSDFKILGSSANMKENEVNERVSKEITELIGREKKEALKQLAEVPPANRIENIPDDLVAASLRGQIDTLYIQKGLVIPGTITEEGRYDQDSKRNDFVELLVDKVINTNASVYVFQEDDMPEGMEIIARLRF